MQDLLNARAGANLGIDFLPGAFGLDGHSEVEVDEGARVLWLDAFTANVDRSWRNPNMLVWHGDLWVIDHGASLYFHHGWGGGVGDPLKFAEQPWSAADHVFETRLRRAHEIDAQLRSRLGREVFEEVLGEVPDVWLEPVPGADTPAELRAAYVEFLTARLGSDSWLPEVS